MVIPARRSGATVARPTATAGTAGACAADQPAAATTAEPATAAAGTEVAERRADAAHGRRAGTASRSSNRGSHQRRRRRCGQSGRSHPGRRLRCELPAPAPVTVGSPAAAPAKPCPVPPPPPATSSRESLATSPVRLALARAAVSSAEEPPPPPEHAGLFPPSGKPPGSKVRHDAAAPAAPTSIHSSAPGVAGKEALLTRAPRPPAMPLTPGPPGAPTAVTLTLLTPAGTVNVSSAPWVAYVQVELAPERDRPPVAPTWVRRDRLSGARRGPEAARRCDHPYSTTTRVEELRCQRPQRAEHSIAPRRLECAASATVAPWSQGGERYLPVGRCAAPRGGRRVPVRRCFRLAPPRGQAAACGVRAAAAPDRRGLSSVVAERLGCTVRNTGPRARSTTATITFEWLGVSNTIPSSSGPSSATFTSSPAPMTPSPASVRAASAEVPDGETRTRTGGHHDFQSCALPTELSRRAGRGSARARDEPLRQRGDAPRLIVVRRGTRPRGRHQRKSTRIVRSTRRRCRLRAARRHNRSRRDRARRDPARPRCGPPATRTASARPPRRPAPSGTPSAVAS